jgi:hypothetical protein
MLLHLIVTLLFGANVGAPCMSIGCDAGYSGTSDDDVRRGSKVNRRSIAKGTRTRGREAES